MNFFDFNDDNTPQSLAEKSETNDVLICATFGQYEGKPISILAMASELEHKPILMIVGEEKPTYAIKNGYVTITDTPRFDNADMYFQPTEFVTALDAYKQLKSTDVLLYDTLMQKYDVGDAVQINGIKDSGRLNVEVQGVTNGHMAVLAICLFYSRMETTNNCMDMMDSLTELYTMHTI